MFSQIGRVTAKALRHYDEIGLLHPARTDPETGYRYYTSAQLPRLHRILALRQMGFSLGDIAAYLDGGNQEALLNGRERALRDERELSARRLQMLASFRQAEKGEDKMNYTATIKELPEVTVASMRRVIPDYQALFTLMPEVLGPEMERLGCRCAEPDYCFCRYHYPDGEYRDHDVDVELCQAVTEKKADSELVHFMVLPKTQAVCVLHRGGYDGLREAYGYAFSWLEENGYALCDNPRESYIDGVWNREREEDWLTELQFPVRKK